MIVRAAEYENFIPNPVVPQSWGDFFRSSEREKMAKSLDMQARKRLAELMGDSVRFDEPMARHTSFRIGGPADALAEPSSPEQLRQLVQWTSEHGIYRTIIGGGTNLLVKDSGIRGVVVRLNRMASGPTWKVIDRRVLLTAGAGLPTKSLCALALRNGWQGANFALGIPGLLGGAVSMNAGTAIGNMSDITNSITLLTARGRSVRLAARDLIWGYRCCRLPSTIGADAVIVEVDLALTKGDKTTLKRQARELMKKRAAGQPLGEPSAGSIFKNPSKEQPAGRLIDAAGLKGQWVGQAQVSMKHANFIVNRGGASADDVIQLIDLIQTTVSKRFSIELTPEVRIVG